MSEPLELSSESQDGQAASEDDLSFILSGCHSIADWKAGQALALRGHLRFLFSYLAEAGLIGAVLIALAIVTRPHPLEPNDKLLLVVCFLLGGLAVGPRLIGAYQLRRYARRQQGVFAPTYSVIDANKMTTTLEGAKSELEWSVFSKLRANETVALLFFKNSSPPLLIARSKLQPPSEWSEFVDFLRAKVPEQGVSAT